jgi:hypothetical protein
MKTNITSPKITSIILAISGLALSAQAISTPISGNISFSGTTTIDSTSFVTATRFLSFQNVVVGAPSALSGDYVGTSGAAVTVTPFIWSPPTASTPLNPLWTFVSGGDTYSFDLSVLHVDYASPTGLLLSGLGTALITGPGMEKLNTTGTWDFSSQTLGQTSFTFSSTTTVPAAAVPDGGSTVAMLGASLLGLSIMKRKQIVSKAS